MSLTREQFAVGLAPVLAVWKNETPSQEMLMTYHRLLAHFSHELFERTVMDVLSVKTYGFPKPADFIDAAVEAVMMEYGMSRPWARQWLDEQRAEYLALASGQRQIGDAT